MKNTSRVTLAILAVAILLAFGNRPPGKLFEKVRERYIEKTVTLAQKASELNNVVITGDEGNIRTVFLQTRYLYKEIEVFAEYFFHPHAVKLNGPPIPFFEESEPYILENTPAGMQAMEEIIFPVYNKDRHADLKRLSVEMLNYAKEFPGLNEAYAFSNATVMDAIMEQLYRLMAMGVTGFDSQTAQNALPETAASLKGLREFLSFYKNSFEETTLGSFAKLETLIAGAIASLEKNVSFNRFDRISFIKNYLDPLASLIGTYKYKNGLPDNPAGTFYSAIRKDNSLFNPGAFNPYRFLGDFSVSTEKVQLGQQLFFEPMLSSNNKQSCASCHQPGKAFTDGLKTSNAIDGHSSLLRNAPTIWNAALQRNLFLDNRSNSLEDQVLQVLNNAKEMHGSAKAVAEKVINDPRYKILYETTYPNSTSEDAVKNICNAIASYERSLIALNSRFDRFMNGENTLTKNEISGFNLFMGKGRCGTCHFMPLFSGAKPPRYYYIESEVLGVPALAVKKNPRLDSDSGRYLVTQSPLHLYSFKTPTLRNIALTAPYMHNGVYNTLEEVMDFYNNGGGQGLGIAPENQTLPFEKLGLNKKEKKDIIAFMKALTDTIITR